ncbi:Ku protein [Pleomorphomonas sp. NRK KF1]|uniref:non-homologous end joining protein Ku n=1 Tax=Pleomorphomonas sp. NRK KF1 TaxID=2943000 RepID=UPI002043C61C|nr:Ku protein [Pleomorphomonas sp. NRK KF1]MCM5551672.1 Ku protein [Pleomorphomonas sp. NRK KF1]
MAPRANWKGVLKIAEVMCPVSLYTAASTSERIVFHTLNRATGHRVERQYIDTETEKPVDREDQVKGYEVSEGNYIELTPDEVKAAVPESDKTLAVSAFIGCGEVDDVYFDKPYYLAPSDRVAQEAYAIVRDGLREKKVAAIARTLLFRRVRTLLIRPHGDGLIATTLNFDYEVRAAADEFREIPDLKIKGEMLELAEHIIDTKMGEFDISRFDDRYEAELAEVVKAKIEGRKIKPRKAPKEEKVIDLMAALRESARVGKSKGKTGSASRSGSRRKAG